MFTETLLCRYYWTTVATLPMAREWMIKETYAWSTTTVSYVSNYNLNKTRMRTEASANYKQTTTYAPPWLSKKNPSPF